MGSCLGLQLKAFLSVKLPSSVDLDAYASEQWEFALERGIPATLAIIRTQRLAFPGNAFDLIHCSRYRVHWHGDCGKPLLELNRILRPERYFIWFATPVYQDDEKYKNVWDGNQEYKDKRSIMYGESMGGAVALLIHKSDPEFWYGAVLVAPMCKICGKRLIYQEKPRLKTALEILRTSMNLEDSLTQDTKKAYKRNLHVYKKGMARIVESRRK
ncbi:hypothetical protein AgCh_021341 [Apium graveolens]